MTANRAGFSLVVDGIDYASDIVPRLVRLSVSEKLGGEADSLELELSNHDGLLAPVRRGVFASLSIGWVAGSEVPIGLVDKGRFMVDEVEKSGPPDLLRIRARAADLTGDFRKRKDKGWKATTLGAVISDLAQANGYSARVHPDLAGIAIPSIEQAAKSDAAFIRDLGARYDAIHGVKNGVLVFLPVGAQENAGGEAMASGTLTRRENSHWRFTIADREDHDGAEAAWHDKGAAKKKKVTAGGGRNARRIKRSFATEGEAREAARAEARKAARGQYEFEYQMALGDPGIATNQRVSLRGWDSEIDGVRWLVNEASHTLDGNAGLTSTIRLVSLS